MNKEQTTSLMREIKTIYPKLSITHDTIKAWVERLENYDADEVINNFNRYIEKGTPEAPALSQLIYGLNTIERKKQYSSIGTQICKRCGRHFNSIEEADKCYERDMDIKYILKMSEKFGIDPNQYFKPYVTRATLETINENYDDFIMRVIQEEKKESKLNHYEKEGIKGYYKNVMAKKKLEV